MLLPWLLGSLAAGRRTAGRRRAAKRQAAARFRPRVELLETRFAPAILAGPNVNITRFPGSQNEAALAMNPTNPLQLFETSNDSFLASGTGGLLVAFSTDGGITWTREFLATPTMFGSAAAACCDSQAVFDDFGNLFVSYINATADTDELLLSTDGGQTFRLIQGFATVDQPKLAVGAGSVWVSYATAIGMAASGARVGGLGSVGAFTVPQTLAGSDGGNFGEMTIGPSGQVFVTYTVDVGLTTPSADNSSPPEIILGNLNPTGVGGTFGPAHVLATSNVGVLDSGQGGATGNTVPLPFGLGGSKPKVEYDRSGGPFNGRLYMVYNDSPSITSVSVDYLEIYSVDDGATWSAPVKINDNTVLDQAFYGSLAIDQSTGALAMQFYDTRNAQGQGGPTNPSGIALNDCQLWASASFDGGVTWDKNVQISAGTTDAWLANDPTPAGIRQIGLGDYMHSTAFFGGVWYPVWADNSNSTRDNPDGTLHFLDIYTAKVTLVAGTVFPGTTPIIPSPGSTGTTGTTGLIPIIHDPPPAAGQIAGNGANAFTTNMWGAWNSGGQWSVVKGDFNGDGKTDIAGFDQKTGQWWVGVSNGTSYTMSVWGQWYSGIHWTNIKAGDFTGDGKTDIIGNAGGNWWVGASTGSSFVTTLWGSWSPSVNWTDMQVADFTGSGMADITARDSATGAWWTGVSTGSSFSTSLWAVWYPGVTWVDVNVGNFAGDVNASTGRPVSDITGRVLQSGDWWTGISNGSGFTTSWWGHWYTGLTWVDVNVGDFNGDGQADIVGRALQTGQWWVGQSTGSGFTNNFWATWYPGVTWVNVHVGDFNNDGRADITGMVQGSGQWWTALSTGSGSTTSLWASWAANVHWVDVQVGNFNGEGLSAMDAQTGQWWTSFPVISSGITSSSSTTGIIPTAGLTPPTSTTHTGSIPIP
jgi:hypothetical protein